MPFGAIASVHEWEKPGSVLLDIILVILRVVCFRYVDDFFGTEPTETLEHTLHCCPGVKSTIGRQCDFRRQN